MSDSLSSSSAPATGVREQLSDLWRALALIKRARQSVRGKVMGVVLLTTAMSLLVAGAAILTHDLSAYRHSWATDLAVEASILAQSTTPALAFDDAEAARSALAALQARPEVLVAALYGSQGNLYATYSRSGHHPAARAPAIASPLVSGEQVEVTQRIVKGDDFLGTIYLQAHYDIAGRVYSYISIFAAIIALSMLVALVLSNMLQRFITDPLESMADVARRVVERREYSFRASKTTDDEIGLVVDAFNGMLDEVQSRARALEKSNATLQDEVNTRQAAEAALARANARLESTMAAAEIGTGVWDLRSNQFTADRNLLTLLGIKDGAQLSGDPTVWPRFIHPDDLRSVEDAHATALQTGIFGYTEFRIVRPDGSVRWLAGRGRVQADDSGARSLLANLLIDITPQKNAEHALRESEKLYRAIGESIEYGVWVCDATGRNIYASDSFLRLSGLTQAQCSDVGWMTRLHPDDVPATLQLWQDCVQSGKNWYREHRILGTDGAYHPVLAQGVAIKGDHGEIRGWAGINLDIRRLKETEEALREADRRKDEFLATLAHELRNPLAPIGHAVKILEAPAADRSQHEWAQQVIARQSRRMALLLDDLLDVSRITSGRLKLRIDRVTLNSLIATAVETARPLIESKRHVLSIELPSPPVELEVDPLRLSQALSNLLANAAKYTDAEGKIRLIIARETDELSITVQDTGIGLSAAALPRVFEMFSQVESAIDRAEGGLGIGLALVRGLVRLHGGRVEARSAGPGCGSEFIVHLPASLISSSGPIDPG
jgi:PAS domain S-box-containing protein